MANYCKDKRILDAVRKSIQHFLLINGHYPLTSTITTGMDGWNQDKQIWPETLWQCVLLVGDISSDAFLSIYPRQWCRLRQCPATWHYALANSLLRGSIFVALSLTWLCCPVILLSCSVTSLSVCQPGNALLIGRFATRYIILLSRSKTLSECHRCWKLLNQLILDYTAFIFCEMQLS